MRLLRRLRGWSQEQLGEACGLHRTYISLVERGACNISLDNLEKLAGAFGLPLSELVAMPEPGPGPGPAAGEDRGRRLPR
jgi:transcriptional regulator with XRE-family HTH domain